MDEDDLFEQIEQEQEIVEATDMNDLDEYINAGYYWTMHRIISNRTGGKKSVEY